MTNSKDCLTMSPAEYDVFPPPRAHIGAEGSSSSRMYAAGQNGGMTPVMSMVKENGVLGIGVGVGLAEKRARDGEGNGTVSSAARLLHVGGGSYAQRGFQDVPEAPPRKRVHVGEGSSSSRLNAGKGLLDSWVPAIEETVTRVDLGRKSDPELDRRLPARHPRTPLRTEGFTGEVGGQDADAIADVGDRRTLDSLYDEDEEEEVEVAEGEEEEGEDDKEEEAEVPDPVPEGITDMDVDISIPDGVEPEGSRWLEVDDDTQLPVPPWEGRSRGAKPEPGVQMDGRYFQEANGLNNVAEGSFVNGTGVHPPPAVNVDFGLKKENDDRRGYHHQQKQEQRVPIEVIEVEDSDDEIPERVQESDESSTKGKKPERVNIMEPQRRRDGGGHRASSSRSSESYRMRHRARSSQFSGSYNPEDEEDDDGDSDDCQVLESIPPIYGQQRDGPSNPVVVDDDDEEGEEDDDEEGEEEEPTSLGNDGSDSDEEVVVLGQTEIRRQWEEAAMRRGLGRVMRSEGSKANGDAEGGTVNHDDDRTESQGLEESVATSTYQASPDSKDQTETSEARGGLDVFVNHRSDGQQGASTSSMRAVDTATGAAAEDVVPARVESRQRFPDLNELDDDSGVEIRDPGAADARARPRAPEANGSRPVDNGETPFVERRREDGGEGEGVDSDGGEDGLVDSLSAGGTYSKSPSHGAGSLRAGADMGGDQSRHKQQANLGDDPKRKGEAIEQQDGSDPLGEAGTNDGDLLAAKDRLKESLHYKNSDAAEWASRQKEIQRQALEVKRLKQRKKHEADRKKDMERKQKERIEELRLSQMKEERNMDLREQMRGQVRSELERVAANCYDFATLLRQLGVSVDGGNRPSVQQVNAAYKKALFKFHPDRAVALSNGDPRQQVEAEEKFKLITRLKDTLVKPVIADYGFTYSQHFR